MKDGSLLKEVKIIDSGDSIFSITKNDIDKAFPIQHLHKITFARHGFWNGFAYGAVGSMVFWTLFSVIVTDHSEFQERLHWGFIFGLIFAAPVGLVSGMISEFVTNDDIYNFSKVNPSARSKWLKKIIKEHEK